MSLAAPIEITQELLESASEEELRAIARQLEEAKAFAVQIGPQTDEELHAFIKEKWGIHVPRVAVTEGMSSPFQFIADIYFFRENSVIGIANREGAKTSSVALIHALFANFFPGYEGISAGAIEEQTKRVYGALKQLNRKWGQDNIAETQATQIRWKNDSIVEPKVGTDAQMNGPHCHPGDELILTTDGYVQISDLDPSRHQLASYTTVNEHLTWGRIHGKISKGDTSSHVGVHQNRFGKWVAQVAPEAKKRLHLGKFDTEQEAADAVNNWRAVNPKIVHPFTVTKWHHDGNMIIASTDAGSSRMTPRHKVRIRTTAEFKDKYVVYLMRKKSADHSGNMFLPDGWGDWWRIGVTKGTRLQLRLNEEEADGIWVLGVYDNSGEAQIAEAVAQAKYGITGVCFTHNGSNNRVNDPSHIHNTLVYDSGPKALELLKSLDMSADLPFFGRYGFDSEVPKEERITYRKNNWFVTAVGNLKFMSGLVEMPSVTNKFINEVINDKPNKVIANFSSYPYTGDVYSIGILPFHYYIANNLVVHNSFLLHRDEIEQFRRSAFNEADNITKSGKTIDGRNFPAIDIYTTSRKKARGLLQEMIDRVDEAKKNGSIPPYKIYIWGVAETIQNQPNCRQAPQNVGRPDEELCNCHRYINGKMPDGTPRSLEKICAGRFFKSDGWRPREPDIAGKFMANSPAMWDAQQECKKPATEGLILADFSKETHGIIDFKPNPEDGKIYQSADFGGKNPHSSHLYQYTDRPVLATGFSGNPVFIPQDSYIVFGEVYIAEVGNNVFAQMIKNVEDNYRKEAPFLTIDERYADVAARAARIDFKQTHGLKTVWRVTREINEHIKIIQQLVSQNRIFVCHTSSPMWCEEAEAWQWDDSGEKQLDTFNHCFPAGVLVSTPDGPVAIEDVSVGDLVNTAYGDRRVTASGVTRFGQDIFRLVLSDGTEVRATGNHPFWVEGVGWTSMADLRYGDVLWKHLPSHSAEEKQKSSSSTESGSAATQSHLTTQRDSIIAPGFRRHILGWSLYTEKSGRPLMGRSQMVITSIIWMAMLSTTVLKIWNAYRPKATEQSTREDRVPKREKPIWTVFVQKTFLKISFQKNRGQKLKQRPIFTGEISRRTRFKRFAITVKGFSTTLPGILKLGSALTLVNQLFVERLALMTSKEFVQSAPSNTPSVNTLRKRHVLVSVVSVSADGNEDVYDLTIDDAHEFYAEGIRVHNSMAEARYAIANIERKLLSEKKHPTNRDTVSQVGPAIGETQSNPLSMTPNTGPAIKTYMSGSPHDSEDFDRMPIHQGPLAMSEDRMYGP